MNKLRLLSLFSGIGAFEKALSRLNIPYELIGFSEIDKFAINSYSAIHNIDKRLNLGDIEAIDENDLDDFDILVGGSPCQNISKCGNNKGLIGDYSRLFYDYTRILNYKKPKYFVFENVDNLLQTNKGLDWQIVKREFEKEYNIYWKILNSKHYDIPQDRSRLFVVGIRRDFNQAFSFAERTQVTHKSIQDMLEDQPEDNLFIEKTNGRYDEILDRFNILKHEKQKIVRIGNIYPKNGQNGNIYSIYGLSPTLRSGQGIVGSGIGSNNAPKILTTCKRIRKTSSLENWRFMGFDDDDYYMAKNVGVSNTQLYKQAGNSIVVNVLEDIFNNLLSDYIVKQS